MALSENMQFVIGPQLPIGTNWFDQTQLSMARMLGKACPAVPPVKPAAPVEPQRKDFADDATFQEAYTTWTKDPVISAWLTALNNYTLHLQYYDLGGSEYTVLGRTDDPEFLGYARNAVDSFWQHPYIKQGTERPWPDNASPPPRHVGIKGFILRALDGRPEMWDFIVAYTRTFLDIYFLWRLPATIIHVDLREGAFIFHFATWLTKVLPDSFPNAAQVRAEFHAKLVRIVNEYYVPLQNPCGCWLYDINMPDTDGGTLVQTTQPFTMGLLLLAFADFHQITTDANVRETLKTMILKTSKHLYVDGPYRKDEPIPFDPSKRWRAFWYLYHGGTTVNPTKFAKGGWSYPGNDVGEVMDARQSIGPVIAIYGYAYKISGDPVYLEAAKEMWDAAYGFSDGIGTYYNTDGKGFNQHCARAGSLWAWAGQPADLPTPEPTPEPIPTSPTSPTKMPSVDPSKGLTIIDSQLSTWTIGPKQETLKDGVHASEGYGSIYKYYNKTVYVLGTDSNWYKWLGSAWTGVGATEPGGTVTPTEPAPSTPTPVPPTGPPIGDIQKGDWPTSEGGQEASIDTWWAKGYRLKTTKVRGAYAMFEKVK